MQTEIRQLQEFLRRFEAAENSCDPHDIVEMMADDVVIMVPNHSVQEGKATCARFVAEILDFFSRELNRRIEYVSAEVRILGDAAFDRGQFSFRVSLKAGGDASLETGKYLFLYLRTGDGSWKLARTIVSLDDRDDEESDE